MYRLIIALLGCAAAVSGCKREIVVAETFIPAGRWILILEDQNGLPVRGTTLTLAGVEGQDVLPFEGYGTAGKFTSDSGGMIVLTLLHEVRGGGEVVDGILPVPDNTVRIDAQGFQRAEFSFFAMSQGRVGTPMSATAPWAPSTTTGSTRGPELPLHCYKIVLKRSGL